jgi:hypothetical protein
VSTQVTIGTTPAADWGISLAETDVDRAVIASLMRWMPTYLTRAERERGLMTHLFARPLDSSYQNAMEDTSFPDGRLPAVVVTTAQTDDVTKHPHWRHSADFAIVVSCIVRGRTPFEARDAASIFGSCARRILVHQQTDIEGEVNWEAGSIIPVPDTTDNGRWLAASLGRFTLYADEVLTGDGPVEPDPDDPPYPPPDPNDPDQAYGNLATIGAVDTTIIAVPPNVEPN